VPLGMNCSQCSTTPLPGPLPLMQPMPMAPQPMGCICPPGANKDCEAPLCPRKNHFTGAQDGR